MATHSTILGRIPGMEEPGGLRSMGSRRVGHDWSDLAVTISEPYFFTYQGEETSKYFKFLRVVPIITPPIRTKAVRLPCCLLSHQKIQRGGKKATSKPNISGLVQDFQNFRGHIKSLPLNTMFPHYPGLYHFTIISGNHSDTKLWCKKHFHTRGIPHSPTRACRPRPCSAQSPYHPHLFWSQQSPTTQKTPKWPHGRRWKVTRCLLTDGGTGFIWWSTRLGILSPLPQVLMDKSYLLSLTY